MCTRKAFRSRSGMLRPTKSTRTANCFRLVSAGVGHSSRTNTRTISAHEALSLSPRSLSGFRRGPREGCEAELFSAVRAQHDSVGHLLESRCAAATSEVVEASRHRASRSIEEADVIEREVLVGFSAPFNSLWSAHGKLGNSHNLLYSQFARFGGKSTGVLPGPGQRRKGIGLPRNQAQCGDLRGALFAAP